KWAAHLQSRPRHYAGGGSRACERSGPSGPRIQTMMDVDRQTSEAVGRRASRKALVAIGLFVALIAVLYVLQPDCFGLWMKALHIIAVISWMAGLFYLPRLFIYHTDAEVGSVQSETFKVMERRLLKVIMNPAMMITWLLGLYLAWESFAFQGGWLHAKIALVLLLTVVHIMFRDRKRTRLNSSHVT